MNKYGFRNIHVPVYEQQKANLKDCSVAGYYYSHIITELLYAQAYVYYIYIVRWAYETLVLYS